MKLLYDLDKGTAQFSIGDFPSPVQVELLSTLDINGFISNELKFREILANHASTLGTSPEDVKQIQNIFQEGQLLPLARDGESAQIGLNFRLNTYRFSLDLLPGRPEKTAAMPSEQELRQALVTVQEQVGNWTQEDWRKLFESLTKEWINKGQLLNAKDFVPLQTDLLANLAGRFSGEPLSNAIVKLHEVLKGSATGMSMASRFLQLFTKKVNAELLLILIRSKSSVNQYLNVIGIDGLDNWILAYLDEQNNFRYAGKVTPFLGREELYPGKSLRGPKGVHWIDPKKQKKVKVKNTGLQVCLTESYLFYNNTVTSIGKKLSAIGKGMEVIEIADKDTSLDQIPCYANVQRDLPLNMKWVAKHREDKSKHRSFDKKEDAMDFWSDHAKNYEIPVYEAPPGKEAAFMPSLPGVPWGQYGPGEDSSAYSYPLETLYPREAWDAWNAYTKLPDKKDPKFLLKFLNDWAKNNKDKETSPGREVGMPGYQVSPRAVRKEAKPLSQKEIVSSHVSVPHSKKYFDAIVQKDESGRITHYDIYYGNKDKGNLMYKIPATEIIPTNELAKLILERSESHKQMDPQSLAPLDAAQYLANIGEFEDAIEVLDNNGLTERQPTMYNWLKERSDKADLTTVEQADLVMREGTGSGKMRAIEWLAKAGSSQYGPEYFVAQVFERHHSDRIKKSLIEELTRKQYGDGLLKIFKHIPDPEIKTYIYPFVKNIFPNMIWDAAESKDPELRQMGYHDAFAHHRGDDLLTELNKFKGLILKEHDEKLRSYLYENILRDHGLSKEDFTRQYSQDVKLAPTYAELKSGVPEGLRWFVEQGLKDPSATISNWVENNFWFFQEETQEELPLGEPKQDDPQEDLPFDDPFESEEDEGLKKESRQPPTTWPNDTGAWNLSPAFPDHRPNQDELFLDDVGQYIKRPEGKYRTKLNWIWKIIKHFSPEKEEDEEKKAALKDTQDAHHAIEEGPTRIREAIEYFGTAQLDEGEREKGLLAALNSTTELGAITEIANQAEAHGIASVIDKLYENADERIRSLAVKAYGNLHWYGRLKEILATENESPSVRNTAVKYLADLEPDSLTDVYQNVDATIRTTIVHNLGRIGKTDFLVSALEDKDINVQKQAVEWLAYHGKLNVLKEKAQSSSTSEELKKEIEQKLSEHEMASGEPSSKSFDKMNEREQLQTVRKMYERIKKRKPRRRIFWEVTRWMKPSLGVRTPDEYEQTWEAYKPDVLNRVDYEKEKQDAEIKPIIDALKEYRKSENVQPAAKKELDYRVQLLDLEQEYDRQLKTLDWEIEKESPSLSKDDMEQKIKERKDEVVDKFKAEISDLKGKYSNADKLNDLKKNVRDLRRTVKPYLENFEKMGSEKVKHKVKSLTTDITELRDRLSTYDRNTQQYNVIHDKVEALNSELTYLETYQELLKAEEELTKFEEKVEKVKEERTRPIGID